jgi:hypothetical protein
VLLAIFIFDDETLLALFCAFQDVFNEPLVNVVPAPSHQINSKPFSLSFPNAPLVSPTKDKTFFSHVFDDDIVYVCDIVLLFSSCISKVAVPVTVDFTQNAIVTYSALLVPFFNNCKSCDSILF